ncbi:MAG: ABC transporter permease [Pontibacterium sp.]
MALLSLCWRSMWHRRATTLLCLLTIALSVALLLAVESIRTSAKSSFANTISGTDLVVGARSSPVQLLLYSVFRMGDATNDMSWNSYQTLAKHPMVSWTIPLSLGDSHRGYRVIGTTNAYFDHYQYGNGYALSLAQGERFNGNFDVVIGANVAKKLGYKLNQPIVIAHGTGSTSFVKHDGFPFKVTGILAPTGTPVDDSLHVSLHAIEAIHQGAQNLPPNGETLTPKAVTAVLLGLKNKSGTFHLQRAINRYPKEALSAILPGVALNQLWSMMSLAEKALLLVSSAVVATGLIGMLAVMLSSLNERRREIAILRATGAKMHQVVSLLLLETTLLSALGCILGIGLLYITLLIVTPVLETHMGLRLEVSQLSSYQWQLIGYVLAIGSTMGAIPAYQAYRHSLSDGMTVKL